MSLKKESPAEQNLPEAFEAERIRESGHDKNLMANPLDHRRNSSAPYLNVVTDGRGYSIEMNRDPSYGYEELAEALGTTDPRIVRGLLTRIVNATMHGKSVDEDALNFMVAFIKDSKPRNARDALLLAQMVCTDSFAMDTLRKMANTEDPVERESLAHLHSKLLSTYIRQEEALRRRETGGEQKFIMQHVSVRASLPFVENNTQKARQSSIDKASPAALTDARVEPMPMIDQAKRPERVPRAKAK